MLQRIQKMKLKVLKRKIMLAEGVKVMLTHNLWTSKGEL
jgi:hypothetical protein